LLLINRVALADKYRATKNRKALVGSGLEFLGYVPLDRGISRISLNGSSIMKLENNAPALAVLRKLKDRIL